MKHKGTILIWTDLINAVLFVALATTGIILRWVLPHGSGGGGGAGQHGGGRGFRGGRGPAPELLDMTRHEWGDIHFWIAVSLVAFVLLHLALHFGWIRAACRQVIGFRRHRVVVPTS
jgi:hypothetical protein